MPFLNSQTADVGSYRIGAVTRAKQSLMLGKIISQSFNTPIEAWPDYVSRVEKENLRAIFQGDQLVGGLALYPMGQWYGGRLVPMTGLAAVGIAPHMRGAGVAKALLTATLQELHGQQVPLAALYASTSHLYRTVGFEQAGSYCRYRLPIDQLRPGDRTLPITPISASDLDGLEPLYQQQAQRNNGNLQRNEAVWQAILNPGDQQRFVYLFGARSHPQGYVIFSQRSHEGQYDIGIRDLVILSPAAGQRFWTLMADHRSLAQRLYWHGPIVDPLLSLLEEQIYGIEHLERWLLRIVNVPAALSLRGYPAAVTAELHLAITDELFSANTGAFVLQVADGKGTVTTGGRGDLQVSIRGLAPLYSGFLSPSQLHLMGQLDGPESAVQMATTLFAGASPWMSDHF